MKLSGMIPLWDETVTDRRHTTASLSSEPPVKVGSVFVCDKPWEGSGSDFFNILKDDDRYRMYYLGWQATGGCGIHVCYAESRDGLHWERPNLGLYEFEGSKDNNILFGPRDRAWDNFFVMKDENPACLPEEKYKATALWQDDRGPRGYGLMCLVSSDGIHFKEKKVFSTDGVYDSVNTLHWSPYHKKYFCFYRSFHEKADDPSSPFNETSVRDIHVIESADFEHWSESELFDFGGAEDYPLYTNCASLYPFDKRYFVGFPTRYVERRAWSKNFDRLSGKNFRLEHMKQAARYGLAITDCVFMSSRDGHHWKRFDEAYLTPGPEHDYNWMYGDCYPAVGLIPTPGRFFGEEDELSMLVEAFHWDDRPTELIRYVTRKEGFASYKAPYREKKLTTKVFTTDADELHINFRTSARGHIYIRVLNPDGTPVPGYDSGELFGDTTDRVADFDEPLSALRGKKLRLEFSMSDAALYSFTLKENN